MRPARQERDYGFNWIGRDLTQTLLIRVLAAILILALAAAMPISFTEAANDPGHDSLYILRGGDNVSGTYNISGMLFVNSTNVGIGTTGPSSKLQVTDAVTSGSFFVETTGVLATGKLGTDFYSNAAQTGSSAKFVRMYLDNAGSNIPLLQLIQDGTGDIVQAFDGATQVFTIQDGGNVGIGTTSPSAPLEIVGTGAPEIKINATTGFAQIDLNDVSAGGANFRLESTTDPSFRIYDVTNSKAPFTVEANTPTDVLYLDSSGNVGIGTTGPSVNLQVNNSAGWGTARLSGLSGGTLQLQDATNEIYSNGSYIRFQSGDNDRMTILSTGNVGIGTTSPAQVLSVVGAANVTGAVYFGNTVCGAGSVLTAGADGLLSCSSTLIDAINQNSTAWTRNVTALQTTDSNLATNISGLRTDNTTQAALITGLLTSNTTQATAISGLQTDNTTQASLISGLLTSNTTQATAISGLQTDNTTQAALITGLLTSNTTQATAISNLVTTDSNLATNISALMNDGSSIGGGWTNTSTTTSTSLNVNVNSGKLFVNATSGNVGIRTTNPQYDLHLNNSAATNVQASLENSGRMDLIKYGTGATGYFSTGTAAGLIKVNQGFAIVADSNSVGTAPLNIGTYYNNSVGIFTKNTQRVIVDENGSVGIGTTTPGHRLEVKSGGTDQYAIHLLASDGSDLGGLYESASGTGEFYVRDASGTAKVGLSASGSSYLTAGNAGINDTTPLSTLTVGSIGENSNYALGVGVSGKNGIYVNSNDYGLYSEKRILVADTSNPSQFSGGVNLATTSGDVGIGLASTAYKLDVNGSVGFRNGAGTYSGFNFDPTCNGNAGCLTSTYIVTTAIMHQGGSDLTVGPTIATNLIFRTNATERMRISSGTGNVGFNTTSPAQVLSVVGAANITGAVYFGNTVCGAGEVLTAGAGGLLACTTDDTGSASVDQNSTAWTRNVTALQTTDSNLATNVSGLRTDNTTQAALITGLLTSNTTQATAISGLQADNTTQASLITGLLTSNTTQATAISGLQTDNTTQAGLISGLLTSNTTQAALITGLLTSNTTQATAINARPENGSTANFATLGIGAPASSVRIEVNGGVRLNTTASKPSCDSAVRGTMWFDQGAAGQNDIMYSCMKNTTNNYNWVMVAIGG